MKDRGRHARRVAVRPLLAWVVDDFANCESPEDDGRAELVFAHHEAEAIRLAEPYIDDRGGQGDPPQVLTAHRAPEADRFADTARAITRKSDNLAMRAARFRFETRECEGCDLAELPDEPGKTAVCPACNNCGECGHLSDCPQPFMHLRDVALPASKARTLCGVPLWQSVVKGFGLEQSLFPNPDLGGIVDSPEVATCKACCEEAENRALDAILVMALRPDLQGCGCTSQNRDYACTIHGDS